MAEQRDFWSGLGDSLFSSTGLIGSQLAQEESKRKAKLELAMKSKMIELEEASAMKTFDYEQSLTDPFKQQFKQTTGWPIESVREGQLASPLAKTSMQVSAKKASLGRPRVMTVNSNNGVKLVWVDPNDPNKILGQRDMGLNPTMLNTWGKVKGDFDSANAIMDTIQNSVDKLIQSGSVASTAPEGFKNQVELWTKTNDPLALNLTTNRKAYALDISKMLNGGRPTDQDAAAVESMLPNLYDNLENANRKLSELRGFMAAKESGQYNALILGQTPNPADRAKIHGTGFTQSDFSKEDARRAALRAPKGVK